MKILLVGLVGLASLGVLALLYTIRKMTRLPENSPKAYLAGKRSRESEEKGGKKTVVCVGDSITHGRISHNYVDLLAQRLGESEFEWVNAGVNSQFAYDVLQRIDTIIACEPDFVTIMIGTNDANTSILDEQHPKRSVQRKLPQALTPEWFRENLQATVRKLRSSTRAQIALLSIPPLGEDPEHFAVQRSERYSRIIREVAEAERVVYLPVHETILGYVRRHPGNPRWRYGEGRLVYKGVFQHHLFGRSFDAISASNGFRLLVDFVHLNSKGAGLVADLIEGFLQGR